ncbi:unnamed protein product [Didymodactylos carnosus]|uniref:Uncharacterized protein n=1 Tax=Didymodactylos carnosus TaxID=1234261 RepID=A0A815TDR7_9BILA|nr:unnamed protein product [Didymodactylos carnosus]CAF4363961.1 unnamed protein product [Didymodactylos carnosus]
MPKLSKRRSNVVYIVFVNDDYVEISRDNHGSTQLDSFCDMFPAIEIETNVFVAHAHAYSQKSAEIKALILLYFVDSQYYKLTGIAKKTGDDLIRS